MTKPSAFATAQALCIVDAIAAGFNVSREALLRGTRHRELAWPRHLAMYLVRAMEGMSLPQIGRLFGGRDHSSVFSACRKTWMRFEETAPGLLHALVDLAERLEPATFDAGEAA